MGGNACTSLHHHLAERLGQRIRTGVDAVQAFITELRVADPRRRRHQVAHVHLAVVAEDHAVAVDHEHAAVGLQLAEDLAGPCVGVVDPVQHRPVRVLQEVQRGVGTNVEGLPVQDRLVCGLFDADLHAAIGALRLDGLAGVGPAPRQRVLIHLQAVLAQPVCDHESRVTPRLPGFLLQPLLQRDGLCGGPQVVDRLLQLLAGCILLLRGQLELDRHPAGHASTLRGRALGGTAVGKPGRAEGLLGLTGRRHHRAKRNGDGPGHRVAAAQRGRARSGRERMRHLNLVNLVGRPRSRRALKDRAARALLL
ncbi:hypothetical protein G6F22_014957 [Rhizopus arrhizus]|nr:hypothetical protein G6F22_014957 [Rhizopus arrhizus]